MTTDSNMPETNSLTSDNSEILETRGLCKSYGGRMVVNDVSISLKRGEIVGLLGPNGAGKTTTFNMVVGIVKPLRGSILVGGQDITRLPLFQRARMGLGYLAQDTSIFRKLSVQDNVLAVLEVLGLSKTEQKKRLDLLLEELGVAHLAKNLAFTLSGGERRRVEIARALATEPKFMLLDEPFSGVDPKAVEEIQEIIQQLSERGLGILITDHSVRETLAVTDRSYIIFEGKISVAGTPADLVNNPDARRLYLGESFYMQLPSDGPGKPASEMEDEDTKPPEPAPKKKESVPEPDEGVSQEEFVFEHDE